MDKTQFWQLIEQTYSDEASEHNENLKAALLELTAREILEFNEIYDRYYFAAYRWDLWAVAYIIGGGCSDDCFIDFRSMLIRRGRKFYEAMLQEPEAAALRYNVEEEDFIEMFSYCIAEAYEELTGAELPPSKVERPATPSGYDWTDGDLDELYPRLCEKFG